MQLVLASSNQGKLREIRAIMEPLHLSVATAAQMGFCREIEETGKTFAQNAELKARTVARELGLPALADDSGLAVGALDGAPGDSLVVPPARLECTAGNLTTRSAPPPVKARYMHRVRHV